MTWLARVGRPQVALSEIISIGETGRLHGCAYGRKQRGPFGRQLASVASTDATWLDHLAAVFAVFRTRLREVCSYAAAWFISKSVTGGSARSQSNGYRLAEPNIEVQVDGPGVVTMTISLETVVVKYLDAKKLSGGTRKEYKSTIAKWLAWEGRVDVDKIERTHIREFLDWVHEKAIEGGGSNPGRTANKARENLRAILSWS